MKCADKFILSIFLISNVASANILDRKYISGSTLKYEMSAFSRSKFSQSLYYATSSHTVKVRAEDGVFFEKVMWEKLKVNGQEIDLSASANFFQLLSLNKKYKMPFPNVGAVHPDLIGPIFDLMNFYVDLSPNIHKGKLNVPGDTLFVKNSQPHSWAFGNIVIGQSCIDFKLTLMDVKDDFVVLNVRHIPPKDDFCVSLPADWMRDPVTTGFNNWVRVEKVGGSESEPKSYSASIGTEIIDVRIVIDRLDGRILTATMHNPVSVVERRCKEFNNKKLSKCGPEERYVILREIGISLLK